MASLLSHSVTLFPRLEAMIAASQPAGPPPITRMLFEFLLGASVPIPHSFSLPIVGFSIQEIGMDHTTTCPKQAWLHPTHGMISSNRPSLDLFTSSGSAICALIIMTASATLREIISSASKGSLIRPTAKSFAYPSDRFREAQRGLKRSKP